MYHVECIDIHKTDKMYLYIDRACLCANNMYNVANFHIRNLMTGLKKDISLRTENEKSVIRTFASSIPAVNFSLRLKHFVKIFRIFPEGMDCRYLYGTVKAVTYKDILCDSRRRKKSNLGQTGQRAGVCPVTA